MCAGSTEAQGNFALRLRVFLPDFSFELCAMETKRTIAYEKTKPFLDFLVAEGAVALQWEPDRHKVFGEWKGEKWSFRLPLALPLAESKQSLAQYLAQFPSEPASYFLILIQAGHSAMAYFENGEMTHHKVIKKYMVRGNGRAQLGYLQTRGKSKAGSRVRLANTITFFEDINEKLREWEKADVAVRMMVSCPTKLQTLWYGSRITPPFAKDDPRITKVPVDVQRPDLEELLQVNKNIVRGLWEGPTEPVDAFFQGISTTE
jgi:hypothetical protein